MSLENRSRIIIATGLTAVITMGGVALAGVGEPKDCTTNTRAQCNGTDGNDDFTGEDVSDGVQGARDIIEGGQGDDGGDGNGGNDEMFGGPGVDGAINDFEGDEGNDFVSGGPGDDDEIEGSDGDDTVLGGSGDDSEVDGGPGDDEVDAGEGNDGSSYLSGGSGENVVHGGTGSDIIDASQSAIGDKERIFGDSGQDTIDSADDVRDVVDCGGGEDTVTFDIKDILKNCENQIPGP